jgi:hypothetical protein
MLQAYYGLAGWPNDFNVHGDAAKSDCLKFQLDVKKPESSMG